MGCTSATSCADLWPVAAASTAATSPTQAPIFRLSSAIFVSRFFMRYQQLTPTQKTPPMIQAEVTV